MQSSGARKIRQRLLLEGRYDADLNEGLIRSYLVNLAEHLGLKVHDKSDLELAECTGKGEPEGFDAFLPLEGSGISLYVWTSARFFAVVLFSCKSIDVEQAESFTRDFFVANSLQALPF